MKKIITTCLLCMVLVFTLSAQAASEASTKPAHRTLVLGLERNPLP